jgi:hypothetical protein
MRIQGVLAGVICAVLVMTGCQSTTEKVDGIIAKIRTATDPKNNAGTIDTEVTTGTVKIADGKTANLTVKFKFPGKMRVEAELDGESFIKACDGVKGWEFSTKSGLREITGKELSDLKFQAEYFPARKNFRALFSSIEIGDEAVVNEKPCIKLTCTPMPAYCMEPVVVYVDKDTYRVLKTEECHNTQTGFINVDRFFHNYRNTGGFNFPMTIISTSEDKIIEINIQDVEWNKPVYDSEFNMPEQLDK